MKQCIGITRLAFLALFLLLASACAQAPASQTKMLPTLVVTPTPAIVTAETLQKQPLHFPVLAEGEECPISSAKEVNPAFAVVLGDGPTFAVGLGTNSTLVYIDAEQWGKNRGVDSNGWGGQKVLWVIDPQYQGLVLIRGHQIDGTHGLRFNSGGEETLDQAMLLDTSKSVGGPWHDFPSYTRVQAPGCYAYQVDGANFSYIIVFRATPSVP